MRDIEEKLVNLLEKLLKNNNEEEKKREEKIIAQITKKIIETCALNLFTIIKDVKDFAAKKNRDPEQRDFEEIFFQSFFNQNKCLTCEEDCIVHEELKKLIESDTGLINIIKGYGTKLYMVTQTNMCAANEFPPNCNNCYFSSVCQSKN